MIGTSARQGKKTQKVLSQSGGGGSSSTEAFWLRGTPYTPYIRYTSYLAVLHDGVDVRVGDGGILAAKHLVCAESQGIQQLLFPKLGRYTGTHGIPKVIYETDVLRYGRKQKKGRESCGGKYE